MNFLFLKVYSVTYQTKQKVLPEFKSAFKNTEKNYLKELQQKM